MKLLLYEMMSLVSLEAGARHRIPQDETDPGVWASEALLHDLFTDGERKNIVHNFMVAECRGERDKRGGLAFNVPAWALSHSCTRTKEERTPAQHLSAIGALLALLGFEPAYGDMLAIGEEEAAKMAAAAHEDLVDAARRLENNAAYKTYAKFFEHKEHSREFCDTVARGYVISRFFRESVLVGTIISPQRTEELDRMMRFVKLYHDAWGM